MLCFYLYCKIVFLRVNDKTINSLNFVKTFTFFLLELANSWLCHFLFILYYFLIVKQVYLAYSCLYAIFSLKFLFYHTNEYLYNFKHFISDIFNNCPNYSNYSLISFFFVGFLQSYITSTSSYFTLLAVLTSPATSN